MNSCSLDKTIPHTRLAYRRDIDGLRAIAVLPVVLYHVGLSLFPGGFVGVDIFFVISGYLITGIVLREIAEGRFSVLSFYERRARRILPALFFMLALSVAGAWLLLLPEDLETFGLSLLSVLGFGANYFFSHTLGDYFAQEAEFHPLLHMWSLAVEEQFYLVFPLLLLVLARGRRTGPVLWALAAASLAWAAWQVRTDPSAAFYHAPPRMWELTAGALLAWGAQRRGGSEPLPRALREVFAGLGLALILWAVFAYGRETPFPGLAALPPVLGTVLLIRAGEGCLCNRVIANPVFVAVGLISYSLYLMHWPVMAFLRIYTNHVGLSVRNMWVALVLSLVAAVVSWALIERPFRDRRRIGRGAIFTASGAALASAAVLGLALIWGQGFPGRFPKEVALFAAGAQDRNPRRAECFDQWPETGLCRIGAPAPDGRADFILWGDSHADALMPGVDAAARAAGKSGLVLGHSGCAPLLGVYDPTFGAGEKCLRLYDRLIETLAARPDVEQVILVARWRKTFGLPQTENGDRLTLRDREHPGVQKPAAEVFAKGLRRSLEALQTQGRKVVLLAPLPEIGWNVPQTLLKQARFGIALPPRPDRETIKARNAQVLEVFRTLTAATGARVVSLTDVLCQPECRIEEAGYPLYVDDDHVSTYAAREVLAGPMRRLFWTNDYSGAEVSQ